MVQLRTWLSAKFALLHGEDSDGRRAAVEAWKAVHVNPEWEVFSFTVCNEFCSWSEIINALQESAPMGADRVVLAPQVDNLFEKAKKLPNEVKRILECPIFGTRLLLVARDVIFAGPGSILSSKPFSDWNKQGSILKVGLLDDREVVNWVESTAKSMKLHLSKGVACRIADQLGNNPGILRRTLEFLELTSGKEAIITIEIFDKATFRLGERSIFAWTRAWQAGSVTMGLQLLRQTLEDDPSGSRHLMLIGQARREVERLCSLYDAKRAGVHSRSDLLVYLGLSSRQDFLLNSYCRTLDKIGNNGVWRLLNLINQADLDIKGQAISRSIVPLTGLTIALCRAWEK